MAALTTISAALSVVDSKKENLKKAFDDLQSLFSPLPLTWPQLDSHFTSLHQSLTHRFHQLQSQSQHQTLNPPPQTPKDPHFSSNPNDPSSKNDESSPGVCPPNDVVPASVTPRNELVVFCEKMDGVGLRNYANDHFQDRDRVQAELPGALRHAEDAGMMVLGALDGFHGEGSGNEVKESELRKMRKTCIVLLKQFRVAALRVSDDARERAMKLALEWKERLMGDDDNVFGALGFLHLVAAFGLVSEFSLDELVEFSVVAPTNEEFPELCRAIGLTKRVPDIVQKLIDKDKHIPAVKYILEFNLSDKFPPVPMLRACVEEAKKLGKRLTQERKSSNESTAREINTLRSVIKIIENYKLESEYPVASLEQQIEQLKRQKTNNKRTAAPHAKPPQHKQQQLQKGNMQKQKLSGIKRPRPFAPVGPAAVLKNVHNVNSTIHHYQQPLVRPSGLFLEHPNPYMSSPAMPFGRVAPTPNVPSYPGPSAGPYVHDGGVPMGPNGNPSLSGSHLSSSEPHVPTGGYYDRASTYGGVGLQHYYQASYYPK
ncbi:hypothetical protein VNO78_27684 [Psophocarpus tetragonolobus]|uniref:FRIGIDA-like protein n=1 Tax=Psophocarpus tetragonolobus TaxID=3891 RepID=A0AAN9XAD3_PSOTE